MLVVSIRSHCKPTIAQQDEKLSDHDEMIIENHDKRGTAYRRQTADRRQARAEIPSNSFAYDNTQLQLKWRRHIQSAGRIDTYSQRYEKMRQPSEKSTNSCRFGLSGGNPARTFITPFGRGRREPTQLHRTVAERHMEKRPFASSDSDIDTDTERSVNGEYSARQHSTAPRQQRSTVLRTVHWVKTTHRRGGSRVLKERSGNQAPSEVQGRGLWWRLGDEGPQKRGEGTEAEQFCLSNSQRCLHILPPGARTKEVSRSFAP